MKAPLSLRLLGLDDKLAAFASDLSEGFFRYSGVEFAMPRFDQGKAGVVETPQAGKLPMVTWHIAANPPDMTDTPSVLAAIEDGDFDQNYDGIVLDDCWSNDDTNFDGHTKILPALLERRAIRSSKCEFLLFSNQLRSVPRNFSLITQRDKMDLDLEKRVTVAAKQEPHSLKEWLRKLVWAELRAQEGREVHERVLVEVSRSGDIRINQKRFSPRREKAALLAFLVYMHLNPQGEFLRSHVFKELNVWKLGNGLNNMPPAVVGVVQELNQTKIVAEDISHALEQFRVVIVNALSAAGKKYHQVEKLHRQKRYEQFARLMSVEFVE